MRQENVIEVNGAVVVTDSGPKTPIGDELHQAGDVVWVDGNCVYGHKRKSTAPVMPIGDNTIEPEIHSCIIIGAIGFNDETYYLMLFVVDTESLETLAVLQGTFLNSDICSAMMDYGAFCYNESLTSFSLLSISQTNNYETLYQINYSVLQSNEINVCDISEGITGLVAWYEQGDTQDCKWRIFVTNGNNYYRDYIYDKNVSNIYASVQKNYDDIICKFKDFTNNTLTSVVDETSVIMNAIKNYDNEFLEKYNGIGINHTSWQTPTALPAPTYGAWELVDTVTYPAPHVLSENDNQVIARSYWLAEGRMYPSDDKNLCFIYNNGNVIQCASNMPNTYIPISGPTITANSNYLSIRAKSIKTNISNIPNAYLHCGHWGFGGLESGDYTTEAEIINDKKPKLSWMGVAFRMACLAKYNFNETIIDGNVVKNIFDTSNTTENEIRDYPKVAGYKQALWLATQNKIQTELKDEEYRSYNEDKTVSDVCNMIYYDIWSFTLPSSISLKSNHIINEPFDYDYYFNKEYNPDDDSFDVCTLTNGTFSKIMDVTDIQCLSIDKNRNPIIINGLEITKYNKETGEEMKSMNISLDNYSLASISTSALRSDVHLQSFENNLAAYFKVVTI